MSKAKRRREMLDMIDALGLEVVDERQNKHPIYRLRNSHGFETSIPVAASPSDHRSDLNKRHQLERFARSRSFADYRR